MRFANDDRNDPLERIGARMIVVCLVDLSGANGPAVRRSAAQDVLGGGLDAAFGLLCLTNRGLTAAEREMERRAVRIMDAPHDDLT